MEQEIFSMGTEMLYPVLLIPKRCTTLETTCEVTDDVFIDLSITSTDTEGNKMCLYSGFCNIKVIENYDVDTREGSSSSPPDTNDLDPIQVVTEANAQSSYPPYSQSQVWIDPARSPFVYNNYDASESQGRYSVYHHQTHSSHITVEQHNTYITQNVYNCSEPVHYSPAEEFEHKKFRKIQTGDPNPQNSSAEPNNPYEDDEFECGVFLSQLSEEIINEKEARAREELRYIGLQSENDALKQLMSTDIQSMSKQQKTILFLGHDSHYGQTIQKIAVNDPSLECVAGSELDYEIVADNNNRPNQKRYQCDKCKQIFDQIAAFKQHMVGTHRQSRDAEASSSEGEVKFLCTECGKSLKSQEKFELHCLGHGDPELECSKCRKVFASKFTLRTHRKIHYRKHQCDFCTKAFKGPDELRAHAAKTHFVFACHSCEYAADSYEELLGHNVRHVQAAARDCGDASCGSERATPSPPRSPSPRPATPPSPRPSPPTPAAPAQRPTRDEIREADSVIAKVMSNKVFLLHAKKAKKHKRYRKSCDVCSKTFDRIGDLKRHLIEHVIRSTLAKNPVNKNGTLNIQCEVCQTESFTKVDRYKAHLREHAKLTLYQCTFCNKSFSDSSNFSKHKKIHGAIYFQCDLCQRKFNSKKMITQHMEYHNNNSPIKCFYCSKEFHFESMLNKHIKCAHTKEVSARFRCRFCHQYFKTLKEKWDHEWNVHNVRKMIVDCLICGSKFRKYSELKRHCNDTHGLEIPPAKKLLKKDNSE
ncbi:unnamed protein product, partial [Iphiclides podalirius]